MKQGKRPEREPIFHTISVDLYRRIEAPFNAAHRLRKQLPSSPHLSQGVRIRKKGGDDPRINVYYNPDQKPEGGLDFEELKKRVPNQVTGSVTHNGKRHYVRNIPVQVKKTSIGLEAYFDDSYRPIPGGCEIRVGSDSQGTLTTPAWHSGYNVPGWVTAGHIGGWSTGQEVKQPYTYAPTQPIGTVTLKDYDTDSAFIEAKPDHYREYDLAKDGGGYMGWNIKGILSEDKVKEMVADWDFLHLQGRNTGRHYEQLLEIKIENGYDRIVFWNHFTDGGDSGGPMYHLTDSNDAYIAGHNTGPVEVGTKNRTWGPAAYEYERVHNLVI